MHFLKIDHLVSFQDGFVLCSLLKLFIYLIFAQSSTSRHTAWHPDIKATLSIFCHLPVVCIFISFEVQYLLQAIRIITEFLFGNFI